MAANGRKKGKIQRDHKKQTEKLEQRETFLAPEVCQPSESLNQYSWIVMERKRRKKFSLSRESARQ